MRTERAAFTIIELLIVMAIIIVLAGLILATSGYVQDKGKRSRAEAEIAAMSAALESYKADNGVYPASTDIDPRTQADPTSATQSQYESASRALYIALSGDTNLDRTVTTADADPPGSGILPKTYLSFKPGMLSPTSQSASVVAIRDPFGNSYGYSTHGQAGGGSGYNPTFDLWSTAGKKKEDETPAQYQQRWIKNW